MVDGALVGSGAIVVGGGLLLDSAMFAARIRAPNSNAQPPTPAMRRLGGGGGAGGRGESGAEGGACVVGGSSLDDSWPGVAVCFAEVVPTVAWEGS
jgi:hypothetical protein